ncbi:MAG: hypothetical protein ACLFQV_03795 [Vulcanimicrobiota bacterium]
MAHAYTPGLAIVERMVIRKERRLPLKGQVEVKVGDKVESEKVVARTELPGNPELVNIANKLGLEASEVPNAMVKEVGEFVKKEDLLAEARSFFGLFHSKATSPITGTIENISNTTGKVLVRAPAIPVEVLAYIEGEVVEVMPEEGVILESFGTFIQGIFGVGGETVGDLVLLTEDPGRALAPDMINEKHKGKILAGGALVTSAVIDKAIKTGVKGIVTGGIGDEDLKKFLGYDLGVAITGSEKKGITLVVTEGFGQIPMADKTLGLLKMNQGHKTSINGATQIRAGVIRPEVIIPRMDLKEKGASKENEKAGAMEVGSLIRVIREPNFGAKAKVVSLPVDLVKVESETMVRVVEVEMEDGTRWKLPRANVEMVEN